ncbi:hypothetical protein [Endozoicomonas ascidiicola]|uniref:hypothetical protein n=1 Tax=Endozoicomonas ascidiicola TaxID=1698521 RepID=UPI00082DF841|nr:hypothetical protein [Endozoicomonas ascidiicola]
MNRFITINAGESSSFWTHKCAEKQIVAVYVRQTSKSMAEVHWDYQPGEACKILFEQEQQLDGYIAGLLDAMEIKPRSRCCYSALTGTIIGLTHDAAHKLAGLIADKLVPLCEKRLKEIGKYNNLPHVKYQREKLSQEV